MCMNKLPAVNKYQMDDKHVHIRLLSKVGLFFGIAGIVEILAKIHQIWWCYNLLSCTDGTFLPFPVLEMAHDIYNFFKK